MSKKTLPKAIRPSVDHKAGPLSEPMPEKAGSAKVRQASSVKADDVSAFTPDERKANARRLVERFAFWSGIAGLLPIPVVDLAAVGGLQIQMLRRLSQIYDVPFSANRGKAIIASLVGTMIPVSTGLGMASMIKTVPVAGTAIGAITTPAMAVGASYVIGMVFIEHFSRGGTLLDLEPPDYREFIKTEMHLRKT
jgi:uncharacterized protein (DUF697 family)